MTSKPKVVLPTKSFRQVSRKADAHKVGIQRRYTAKKNKPLDSDFHRNDG